MWLDVKSDTNASRAAEMMTRWAMGDNGKGAEDHIKQVAEILNSARPAAVARVAVPQVEGNGQWLDQRRLVAIKFADAKSLKGADLRRAIAQRWSQQLGVGGLTNMSFVNRNGVECLSAPLMESAGPALLERGGLLIVSNDAALIREYLAAPAAAGFDPQYDRFLRIEPGKSADLLSRLYSLLAERTNWELVDSESFFSDEATALLPVRRRGKSEWVCVQCLPRLIHG